MTRAPDGDVVRLSPGTLTNIWIAVAIICGAAIAPIVTVQGRLTAVETKVDNNAQRIANIEQRLEAQRTDWLQELRQLRQDLKKQ